MPSNQISELFDRYDFFNMIIRNPQGPLAAWETACVHITDFFCDLQLNLQKRMHENRIVMPWVRPAQPKQMFGELCKDFQLRQHHSFFTHFRIVCYQIQDKLASCVETGELQADSLMMLLDEVDRLDAHLTVIEHILDPSTRPVREQVITPEKVNNEIDLQEIIESTMDVVEIDSKVEIDPHMEENRSVTIAGVTENDSFTPGVFPSFASFLAANIDSPVWEIDMAGTSVGRIPDMPAARNCIEKENAPFTPGQITRYPAPSFSATIDSPIWEVDMGWTPFGLPVLQTTSDCMNKQQHYFSEDILRKVTPSSTVIDPTDFLNVKAYKKLLVGSERNGEEKVVLKKMKYSIEGIDDATTVLYQINKEEMKII